MTFHALPLDPVKQVRTDTYYSLLMLILVTPQVKTLFLFQIVPDVTWIICNLGF